MAGCFESLTRTDDAIRSYKRALQCSDNDGTAVGRLAALYADMNEKTLAVHYYKMDCEHLERVDSPAAATACLYLANYYKDERDYKTSEHYASMVLDYGGPEREEAKALLRDIQSSRATLSKG